MLRGRGRGPARGLAVIAVAYMVAQVALVGIGGMTTFDEAIYLSEVLPGAESISWAPHRARGIVWLLWPVAWTASVEVVRWWLVGLSGLGLWLAFRPWVAATGPVAVVAAALFASSWGVLLYGPEVSPNLPSAFAAVAAVGLAVAPPVDQRPALRNSGIALAMAAVAVLRPVDVVWVLVPLIVLLPAVRGRVGVRRLLAALVGTAVGWIPWIVEAAQRFDGPVSRFRDLRGATLDVDPLDRIRRYLSIVDGPRSISAADVDLPVAAAVVGAAVAVACAIGVTARRSGADLQALRVAGLCAVATTMSYVMLTDAVAIRFLLTAWGLGVLCAAAGVVALARSPSKSVRGALAASLVAWTVWQGVTTWSITSDARERFDQTAALAEGVSAAVERPCYLFVEGDYPSLGLATGCAAGWYRPGAEQSFRHTPEGRAAEGFHVYALTRSDTGPVTRWPLVRTVDGWRLSALRGD